MNNLPGRSMMNRYHDRNTNTKICSGNAMRMIYCKSEIKNTHTKNSFKTAEERWRKAEGAMHNSDWKFRAGR
jgi:hypothetical protein